MSQVWQMVIVIALIAVAGGYIIRAMFIRRHSHGSCRNCTAGMQSRTAGSPKSVVTREQSRHDA